MLPDDLVQSHFRITATQHAALKRLGIFTIRDLLWHFPARYETISEAGAVANLVHGASVTLYGSFTKIEAKRLWKSKRAAAEGMFEDATGRIKVIWFNQPYMANKVPVGQFVKLSGTVSGKDKPYITNPEVEPMAQSAVAENLFDQDVDEKEHTLFPVYPESQGITSRWFYHAIKRVFENGVLERLEDGIDDDILKRFNLPTLTSALVWLHTPKDQKDAEAARKRFSFEEMFLIQIANQKERKENEHLHAPQVSVDRSKTEQFTEELSFSLTGAQERAIDEIFNDFEKKYPMARLLEGDVGSGKTVVAAATAYSVVNSRPPNRTSGTLQVAYMAPTEILATQHFFSFIEFFKELPINIALITGSACYKFPSKIERDKPAKISRAQLLKWVGNGEVAMLVGTHALIQKAVAFQNLAYVIVDEQHRFGTNQRRALAKKADAVPHFLSMTATPIPRTLALTMYGDLDLSVLDQLPAGRAKVETELIKPDERERAYEKIRKELALGRQAYVICPRIEEPDPKKFNALQAKSAKAEAARLKADVFPEYEIGLLHGAMKPKEKETAMELFANKQIDILVATSVVEVGINVPNATVILIEGAERFGLAQLHQLRGRVQRSAHQPYCFLLPDTKSDASLARLKALAKTSDGFKLAEEDLKLRGAGDLYGRKQWGMSDLGMEALKNPRLIEAARKEAADLVKTDPTLVKHSILAERVQVIQERLHRE